MAAAPSDEDAHHDGHQDAAPSQSQLAPAWSVPSSPAMSASTASPSDRCRGNRSPSAPRLPHPLLLAPNQLAGAEVAAIEASMLFRYDDQADDVRQDEDEEAFSSTFDQEQSHQVADRLSSAEANETICADVSAEPEQQQQPMTNDPFPPSCSNMRDTPTYHLPPSVHSPTCPIAHPSLPDPTHLDLPRPISSPVTQQPDHHPHPHPHQEQRETDLLLPHRTPNTRRLSGQRTSFTIPSSSVWSGPELCCGAAVRAAKARRKRLLLVYSAIFCVCFCTSLEANTSYLYYNWGLSEFGALASFSTLSIAQQMVYAVAKPPIAVISDVFGRAEALALALVLYSGGFAIAASATTFRMFLGGVVTQSAGTTGIQVLQSIIVADTTSPQYRGLVLGMINLPYLINFALAGPLADLVVQNASWRVGIAAYAVLVPLAALPLLVTLSVGERKARTAGLFDDRPPSPLSATPSFAPPLSSAALLSPAGSEGTSYLPPCPASWPDKFRRLGRSMDFVGLGLFAVGWLLVLLPLTLRDQFTTRATAQYALAGALVLGICLYWQTKTRTPIVPIHVLRTKQVIYVCLLGLVDFASFTLTWTYLSAFVQILRGWDQTRTAYFATTQNITSTLVGLMVGWAMSATRRFRTLMILGVIVRIVGVGLMVRFRNAHDPTPLLVLCQLMQGVGGGAVAITMQVAAQVCAGPREVASVTAFQLLVTEVGACLGSATAGLIVSDRLPHHLRVFLPHLDPAELRKIYGSLTTALSYPLGSPERSAIIAAWVQVMHSTCIVATLVLVPALVLAWAMPNATLRTQSHPRPRRRRARRRTQSGARLRTTSHPHLQPRITSLQHSRSPVYPHRGSVEPQRSSAPQQLPANVPDGDRKI